MATGRQPARDFGPAFSANADTSPLPRPDQSSLRQRVADLEFVLRDLLTATAASMHTAAWERAERVLRGETP